jgi:hypothetical protein
MYEPVTDDRSTEAHVATRFSRRSTIFLTLGSASSGSKNALWSCKQNTPSI